MRKLHTFYLVILVSLSSRLTATPIELQRWLTDKSIVTPLHSDFPIEVADDLRQSLRNKRMVFLGESDHYFHEKFAYRLKFIKFLLKLGYYNIIDEIGVADGKQVNKYLETGNEDYLKKVGLFGFAYGSTLKFKDTDFVKENIAYYKELRKLKLQYPQLYFSGYDLDIYPGTFLVELDEFKSSQIFAELSSNPSFVSAIMELEKIKEGDGKPSSVMRIKKSISMIERALDKLSNLAPSFFRITEFEQLLFDLLHFRNSMLFKEVKLFKKYSIKSFAWRERRMFEIVARRFGQDDGNQKYIFLGHNGHLIKTDEFNSQGERYTDWNTIGAWITRQYPDEVFAVWSLIGKGSHSGHGCPMGGVCSFEAKEGSLEDSLLQISADNELFFKSSSVLAKHENKVFTLVNAFSIAKGKYGSHADAYYFIPLVKNLNPKQK